MKKENFIIVGITLIIVTISVSLAYFAAKIVGTPKDVSLSMKGLYVEFTDNTAELNASGITPGWTYEKTFTIENKSESDYKYNIIFKDLINTFVTGNLQYKITNTSSNGGYSMSDFASIPKSKTKKEEILVYSVGISSGVKQVYKLELRYLNSNEQNSDMGKKFSGKLFIDEGTEAPSLYDKILSDNPTRSTRETFTVFTDNTTGTLFTATEQIGTNAAKDVYYFAGNTTNNWVKFANFYWRIIRTNADGSIKLLYAGTSPDTTSGYIGTSAFNTTYNDPMYVGYKYGTSGSLENNRTNENDSTIKTYIDNWYKNNLTDYTKFLSSDAVYCNDRSLASGSTYSTTDEFDYASYKRLSENTSPTYNCTNMSDAFSVNNTSAKLDYPIGLITVDELSYAGGRSYATLDAPYAWYYTNANGESITGDAWIWSISPIYWNSYGSRVWDVYGSGNPGALGRDRVGYSSAVRPAISLKSCTKWASGDGSSSNPYKIDLDPDISC